MKTIIAIIVTTIAILSIASIASSATNLLPKEVTKFQDGNITCYIYNKKSISCVNNLQTKEVNNVIAPASGSYGA